MDNIKSCCLIVTFNRKDLLCRCVEACLGQNLLPDVLIFDNASTDGTKRLLKEKGYIDNKRVIYIESEKNLGGAGGFSNGLKKGIELGYDFVWMMDDDGYPRHSESLSECIKAYNDSTKMCIVNAFVYAENNYMSFKLAGCDTVEAVDKKYNKGNIPGSISPFNGTLISKEIAKKIGYPRADFFIKGDEGEYVERAKFNGIGWLTARKADFYHPRFIVGTSKFLGISIPLNEEPAWKEYCRARNYYYLKSKYNGCSEVIRLFIVEFIKCLTYKKDRANKIKATICGLIDGMRGIYENERVMKYRK